MTGCGTTSDGGGEVGGNGIGREVADVAIADLDGGARGILGVGAEHGDRSAVAGFDGRPFDAVAGRKWRKIFARDGDAPEMTAIGVVLVGREEDGAPVGGKRGMFDFKFAR